MEHPGAFSTLLARPLPWRTAALVAAGIATVELLILVGLGVAFVGRPLLAGAHRAVEAEAASSRGSAEAAAASGSRAPSLRRAETAVLVLNGNGEQGAAALVAEQVRGREYLVAGTGNAPRSDFRRSLIMFRPGFRAEAGRLARDLGLKRVAPLDGLRAVDLQGAHVALIVGQS